jgi:hypothetical protein
MVNVDTSTHHQILSCYILLKITSATHAACKGDEKRLDYNILISTAFFWVVKSCGYLED